MTYVAQELIYVLIYNDCDIFKQFKCDMNHLDNVNLFSHSKLSHARTSKIALKIPCLLVFKF